MLDISRVDLEHTERNMLDIAEFLWWVRLEVGYMVINHSDYVVDDQDLKRYDVTLKAYLDEELAAGCSMGITFDLWRR
jgi:DNA-binding LytR/AlgR family response regulator